MRSYLVVIDETSEARVALRYAARRAARTGGQVELPVVLVRQGDPVKAIADLLKERDDIAALVLGAAPEGGPGPLVSHFSGAVAGTLPCPLVIVPGRLDDEALDQLS